MKKSHCLGLLNTRLGFPFLVVSRTCQKCMIFTALTTGKSKIYLWKRKGRQCPVG